MQKKSSLQFFYSLTKFSFSKNNKQNKLKIPPPNIFKLGYVKCSALSVLLKLEYITVFCNNLTQSKPL